MRVKHARYFIPIFVCLCAVYLLDGNVDGNELDTLSLALHRIDPTYMPGDFRLSMAPGPRLPFQILLVPLLRTLTFHQLSIVGRLGLYALIAGGYARLAAKVGLDVVETIIAGAIYVLIGCDICTGEFMVVGIESKAIAYAAVLWGLDAGIDRRWARAGACFGLAVTFHPAVGAWSALAAFAALWRPPAEAWRRALPIFALAAVPGIALSLAAMRGPSSALGIWAYVYFRHPHHLVPIHFLRWPEQALRFAVALALFLRSLSMDFATAAERTLARFARATMVIFIVGLGASLLPHAEWFLYTYPFRVGDTLFPLFVLMLLVRRIAPHHLPELAKRAAVVVVAALCVVALWRDIRENDEWAQGKAHNAYAWVRANTPRDVLVLCPASMQYASLAMQRRTVADVKAVPTAPNDVAAWYARIIDLNGGKPTVETGFDAFAELEESFEAMPPAAIHELAVKYGASYVLWPSTGRALPYEKLYDDGIWSVLRIRQ